MQWKEELIQIIFWLSITKKIYLIFTSGYILTLGPAIQFILQS